jgi:tetratricopeptide (TPR) repeat protein
MEPFLSLQDQGPRQSVDFSQNIFFIENHDEAYPIWRASGFKERILIHIDAHDDLEWISDNDSIDIGNFICPALKEDIVREVYWVVPDQTWSTKKNLKPVLRRVSKIIKPYPGDRCKVEIQDGQICASVWGRPFRVCTLDNLPQFQENVLLDIDIDFLVIARACNDDDQHQVLPWCWPDNLVAKVNDRSLRTDLITIAYSVEGGFTPLNWKYLGDELALRLKAPINGNGDLKAMDLMRSAALAVNEGEFALAENRYLEAKHLLPDSPAPVFHLALLYLQMDRPDRAKECYRLAVTLDPSYRTAYNSAGFRYFWAGRFQEAEQEHRRTLAMDPENALVHLGLGQIAIERKQWQEAETWLKKSLEYDNQLIDTYRALGKVLTKQGRLQEAIAAYETSLKLSLAGHKSLQAPILTNPTAHRLLDPAFFRVHAILARLYELQGEIDTAINGYRISIAAGCPGVLPPLRLAHLYLKRGQWQESLKAGLQACKSLPSDLKELAGQSWHQARNYRLHLSIRALVGR